MLFEKQMDPDSLVGQSKFIAAFAQPHEGDVSPNTRGPRCQKTGKCARVARLSWLRYLLRARVGTLLLALLLNHAPTCAGLPCHTHESSCPGSDRCVASGPGKDMFESTRIIGEHQFLKALVRTLCCCRWRWCVCVWGSYSSHTSDVVCGSSLRLHLKLIFEQCLTAVAIILW